MTTQPNIPSAASLRTELARLPAGDDVYAASFVELLLATAQARGASDVHLTPLAEGLDVRWRVDGVLEAVGVFPRGESTDVVTRLKVLAELLTYRQDVPQEGRLKAPQQGVEMRVSTFPTLFGQRAVVRLLPQSTSLTWLADLALPGDIQEALAARLAQTSGAIIFSGPAGSGKTTTAYACLRELLRGPMLRSVVTLEDPIECVLPGAVQAAMSPAAGFDFATALRSLMRQDPEIILVGEVRDRETAQAAFQAALTGHLVLTTFHAASACGGLSRLADMGIEAYVLRSGLQTIVGQRLVRRLCQCAVEISEPPALLGLPVASARVPRGCAHCAQTGYVGRRAIAELLPPLVGPLAQSVLAKADKAILEEAAVAAGMTTFYQAAIAAVAAGQTSPSEVRRTLGIC